MRLRSVVTVTSGWIIGGSEVTVQAALNACEELNNRLLPYRKDGLSWQEMIASVPCDVSLNSEGW